MFYKLVIILLLHIVIGPAASKDVGFTYHGFQSANLSLDGIAEITSNGLLKLTNSTKQGKGYAFYQSPINFKNSQNGSAFSFSTSFVFAIVSEYPTLAAHGIVFVIAPRKDFPGAYPNGYFGLVNESNNGNLTNHLVGVELDTIQSNQFRDIDDNHLGIDINGLESEKSERAGYYDGKGMFHNLSLTSGHPLRVWVEYNEVTKQINVTLAPLNVDRPSAPLLSLPYDISLVVNQDMYVGFSSSTGPLMTSHYVLGWSFETNGKSEELDLSKLPRLPRLGPKRKSIFFTIALPAISLASILVVISGVVYHLRRKRKYAEVLEDWELEYRPHRFKYKDLYAATNGFRDRELLGTGGFGRVYKGVLPTSKIEVAIKRVSHESRQGMREFVAEIVSIGRLCHRNIVPLLGYCRRKDELHLVYECMPNGSLDKFIYGKPKFILNWSQRFRIIKGVASGLLYLHEEWEQVVVHRDIKASNVLLDGEFNGRLGDFGLARLYDHGTGPQTTRVVGTLGYVAPEHTRTGKATTISDVYSFGAFLLEVACGRRPIEPQASSEDLVLVDMVYSKCSKGEIFDVVDPKLGGDYVPEEVELVLKLGLFCSHSDPMARPSMRQVVLYLEGAATLPDLSLLVNSADGVTSSANSIGLGDFVTPFSSAMEKAFSNASLGAESFLSGGR